jgi:hypothetical protein
MYPSIMYHNNRHNYTIIDTIIHHIQNNYTNILHTPTIYCILHTAYTIYTITTLTYYILHTIYQNIKTGTFLSDCIRKVLKTYKIESFRPDWTGLTVAGGFSPHAYQVCIE